MKPPDSVAQGTFHAAYQMCLALARKNRYSAFHVYQERRSGAAQAELMLPSSPPTVAFEKPMLRMSSERYSAIYVANGEQMTSAPHVLRPERDWAPVICSIGTAHSNSQWMNLLLSLVSGQVRSTDGFIFKSQAAARLFRRVWDDWSARFNVAPFPDQTIVIPNGVDVTKNRRSDALRTQMRRQLRVADEDILFLSFSRLSQGTKGDQQALVARWKDVLTRVPRAVLLLSGAVVERPFLAELRLLARSADVAHRVLVLDNPFEIAGDARNQLMSAADVFLHLSTGIEETSSLVVHEAMAHGLPVIAAAWAGMPEVVSHGETGFLIETRHSPVAPLLSETLYGLSDTTHAIAASRLVSLDWAGFVAAVDALAHADRRQAMGNAARRSAESGNISEIADRYINFFEATSREAQRVLEIPTACKPLVDLNDVVSSMAGRALDPKEGVRLGNRGRAELLTAGLLVEAGARVASVLAVLENRPQASLTELAHVLAQTTPGDRATGLSVDQDEVSHRELEDNGRLLIRMLNFGVLELV